MNLLPLNLLMILVGLCASTPYKELNKLNLNIYAKARSLDFENISYLMINGDSPYLYFNGTLLDSRKSMTPNTTYEILKEISHLSLAIISQFGNRCGKSLSDDQVTDFQLQLSKMQGSFETVYTSPLIPNELKGDQIKFINESIKVVQKLLEKLKFDCADMQTYVKNIRPILDKNVFAASLSQLTNINELVRSWIDKYPQVDWKSIYILQCSAHMPREKNILAQYFQKLMGIKYEGEQFVYAETGDETACRNLLKTHITDRTLAVNFFNEPMRMHRDLLSDAAEKIVPMFVPESLNNSADCSTITISLTSMLAILQIIVNFLIF